jgi:hypothetical protein
MPLTKQQIQERLVRVRLIVETQAEMCLTKLDALVRELDEINEDGLPPCPNSECAEEQNLSETTEMGGALRITCLECGQTWYPPTPDEPQEVVNG